MHLPSHTQPQHFTWGSHELITGQCPNQEAHASPKRCPAWNEVSARLPQASPKKKRFRLVCEMPWWATLLGPPSAWIPFSLSGGDVGTGILAKCHTALVKSLQQQELQPLLYG